MRFKLGRICRGMRRQSRGNNDKRPGSAVASHWCRQLCDLSLLPLAVKMAKRRIYVILPPKFYTFTQHFCALVACWQSTAWSKKTLTDGERRLTVLTFCLHMLSWSSFNFVDLANINRYFKAALVYCAFIKIDTESTVIPLNLYQDLDLIMFI